MPTFERLTRAALKTLPVGARIAEHGIYYEKLPNGDGRFGIQLRIDGQKVNRVIGKESEGVSRGDAEAVIERLKTESRENRLRLPKGRKLEMRFTEASKTYQERLKESGGKNLKRKDEAFKYHLNPFFGPKPLSQLSTFDIERYKAKRKEAGAANGTINQELAILSHLYSSAILWKWISERPFEVKKLPVTGKRTAWLTPEQCVELLDVARTVDHELYLFIKIGLSTGMRSGEIMSIRLENLFISQNQIFIPEGFSKTGERVQPITSELAEYLRFYLKQYVADTQVWLFPSKMSKTGHRVSFRKSFRAGIKAIGLDPAVYVRHTMRHTVVSMLVQNGVDLHTVMSISGHKTEVMVRRYSHRDGQHIQQAMNTLEAAIQQSRVRHVKEA